MQIKFLRDAQTFVIVADITKEDVEILKKNAPDALKIKDDEGNEVFAINYVEGTKSLAKFGVTFGSVTTDGKLSLSCRVEDAENPQDEILDIVSPIQKYLEQLEASIPTAVEAVKTAREALASKIVEF